MACGEFFGHEDCNFQYLSVEREGHKADREAYTRSKNKQYKRKIQAQQKLAAK